MRLVILGHEAEPGAEEHRERIQQQFGTAAQEYVSSSAHAAGDDLEVLASWAEGGADKRLLDVATGGGHTAMRLSQLYGSVVASDITGPMLEAAAQNIRSQRVANVEFAVADGERLPFESETFDAVSCRIAPHHFRNPSRFVAEVSRVLKPGGIFLLEDSIAPEEQRLDAVLNQVEWLRDQTHVKSLTAASWKELLSETGLTIEGTAIDRKRHEFEDWMGRSRTPSDRKQEIQDILEALSPDERDYFLLEFDANGTCIAMTDEKLLVKARKAR